MASITSRFLISGVLYLFCGMSMLSLAPAQPPTTVLVGSGGSDGFIATGGDGTIHVIYGGKYRNGPSPDQLKSEETITDIQPVNGVRMAIDGGGRPHVVFTAGTTDKAKRSYYTARMNGRWLPAEKFADADDFPERPRAYVADVAVDEQAHVLVCFWVSRPREKRQEFENPSFYYRWRTPDGAWSEPFSLPAHWSSAPKVEYAPGRGFYLLWQYRSNDWRIAGPVAAGGRFTVEGSVPTGTTELKLSTLNEGADFQCGPGGVMVVAGNIREKFEGPVGVWAAAGTGSGLTAAFLGSFPETVRGDESGIHPVAAYDAATGTAFVTVKNRKDNMAYFTVHQAKSGWHRGYVPLLPGKTAPQGTLRQGPSVADIPGPGVVALVRDGDERWYLRIVRPEDGVSLDQK